MLQRVEKLEAAIAQAIRTAELGWSNDQVENAFYRGGLRNGCEQYYAIKAGPLSRAMRSWRCKFFRRWGLKNAATRLVYKSRKGDESIYDSIIKAWDAFYKRIDEMVSQGADRKYIVLLNLDETGLRRGTGLGRCVVPMEQLRAGNTNAKHFETEVVSFSVGNVLTSVPNFPVVPFVSISTKCKDKKQVLEGGVSE
eukprot:g19610.t1